MSTQTHTDIWVVADLRSERLFGYTLNLLAKAGELAQAVSGRAAVVVLESPSPAPAEPAGLSPDEAVARSLAHGADLVYRIADPLLAAPRADKMLAITRECRTILLNRRPFCLAFKLDELRAAGAGHVRADFVNRAWPARAAAEAWRKLRAGEAPGPWHAANIERVLQ